MRMKTGNSRHYLAAVGRITCQRRRFIVKGAKYCLPVMVTLGFIFWGIFVLTFNLSSPCKCISDMDKQKEASAHPQFIQHSTAELQWESPQSSTANENANGKQHFTMKPNSGSYKHKTTLITRTSCAQKYFLLILVTSSPSEVQRRTDIRQTWGVDTYHNPRWKTLFLVAQSRLPSESETLLREDETFGDLVRGHHFDHYANLTLKTRMAFEWASRYCNFFFLLKVDDDVFVNTWALVSFLKQPSTPQEKLYMGRGANTVVYRGGKFGISKEEYAPNRYPPFCPGFGNVFSADVINLFLDVFDLVPMLRLEDVSTGLLADRVGVKPTRNNDFEFQLHLPPKIRCSWRNSTLLRHEVTGKCLFQLFNETNFHYLTDS